jgi:transketolase
MALSEQRIGELNELCRGFRLELMDMLFKAQSGHPGGSLSVCEILTSLYFAEANVDPQNPGDGNRDRIVLSKGHAAPMLYIELAEKGFFPKDELKTLRCIDTRMQGHPSSKNTPGVDLTAGPLGMGLSAGVGMAVGLRMKNSPATVYVVLGDGEINEGTVWEACMSASKFGTDNLIAILDKNNVQLDGTADEIMPMGDVAAKFTSFGFEALRCDGHDIAALCDAIEQAKAVRGKPVMIIADTVKGKGVSFMEGQNAWHGKPLSEEDYQRAVKELGREN